MQGGPKKAPFILSPEDELGAGQERGWGGRSEEWHVQRPGVGKNWGTQWALLAVKERLRGIRPDCGS